MTQRGFAVAATVNTLKGPIMLGRAMIKVEGDYFSKFGELA